jgi:ABC-2 type transport system ATP-binding protein
VRALDDVDLSVPYGAVHGLIGPNGAGKSTLLRALFGLVRPDCGLVAIHGREHDLDGTPATLEAVAGFVDRPQFFPYMTARSVLGLLADADGTGGRAIVGEVLDRVGLTDVADRKVAGWSTGMRQRLGLAAALLRRPRVLLLDEPTEGVDPVGTLAVARLLRELAEQGVTVLLSSHDMEQMDGLCDSATILSAGRVALDGTIDELRAAAPHGRQRLRTTDDDRALRLATGREVRVEPAPGHGLYLSGAPQAVHSYVCDLGRNDVAVVGLDEDVAPLTALFEALTGDGSSSSSFVTAATAGAVP